MFHLKIDNAKSFIPLKKFKGTASRRLERARELNDKFYYSLKDNFTDGEMTRCKFLRLMNKAADTHFQLYHDEGYEARRTLTHAVDEYGTCKGYTFYFNKNINSEKVKNNDFIKLLNMSMQFFNEILNPKFFKRQISMINRGKDINQVCKFFDKSINIKGKLDKKELNGFLKQYSLSDKIDALQLLRYDLIKAKNFDVYKKHYMVMMNETPRSGVHYSEASINSNSYMYDEKIQMIEQELTKAIQKARSKK